MPRIRRAAVVVFSNLDFVIDGGKRLSAHVAVLQDSQTVLDESPGNPAHWQLIGFVHDATVQTFAIDVAGPEFELKAADGLSLLTADGREAALELDPMATGAVLRFAGVDQPIQLIAHDSNYPIRVDEINADYSNARERVLAVIHQRIAQFRPGSRRAAILWGSGDAEIA